MGARAYNKVSWRPCLGGRADSLQILRTACTFTGYPVHLASHDHRALAFQAALADTSNRLQEVQYSAGHNVLGDRWAIYIRKQATVDFQTAILRAQSHSELAGKKFNRMTHERNAGARVFQSRRSRADVFDDEDLRELQLRSTRLKHENQLEFGAVKGSPRYAEYLDVYADFESQYRLLHARHRRRELTAYHRLQNPAQFVGAGEDSASAPIDTDKEAEKENEDAPMAYNLCLDAWLSGEAVEGDVEAAMVPLVCGDSRMQHPCLRRSALETPATITLKPSATVC